MYKLTVKRFFDAAHQLPDTPDLKTKGCARLHGHTYCAIVSFASAENERNGMVVDFKAIKDIVDELDHQFINDIFNKDSSFIFKPSTAENIAFYLTTRIMKEYPDLKWLKVGLCEGYKGKEHSSWVTYEI